MTATEKPVQARIPEINEAGRDAGRDEADNPILDAAVLESLRELDDGAGEIMRETVGVFLETTPERLAGIELALAAGDVETVERLAHTLKSSSGIVGGRRMMGFCKSLEHAARAGGLGEAPSMLERISEEFALLQAELGVCCA